MSNRSTKTPGPSQKSTPRARPKPQKSKSASSRRADVAAAGGKPKIRHPEDVDSPALTIKIGKGKRKTISPEDFTDAFEAEVLASSSNASGGIDLNVINLLQWPDELRWRLFGLVRKLGARIMFRVDGEAFEDPFLATIEKMVGADDFLSHRQSLRVVKEAAAVFHPGDVDSAAGLIVKQLVHLGAPRIRATTLIKSIKELVGSGNDGAGGEIDPRALAAQFLDRHRKEIGVTDRAEPTLVFHRSEFFEYLGHVWCRFERDRLLARIARLLQLLGVKKLTAKLVFDVQANLGALALFDDWAVEMPFEISSIDPPEWRKTHAIIFENGLLDLNDIAAPILKPYDSRYFTTLALPFEFDPNAQCPRWQEFLNQILPNQGNGDERQRVLQQFVGYTLLTDCRLEKMLILIGSGANGKSTLLRVWEALLGEDNVSHVEFEQLGQEFRLYSLNGKAANFCSELDHLSRSREGMLKALISGETITTNRKNLPPVPMTPFAKLVVAANHLPHISDNAQGTWRRIITMPLNVRFSASEANVNLANELKRELPGIMNWALAGLQDVLQHGFAPCSECERTLAAHRNVVDSVAEFVNEFCAVDHRFDTLSQTLFEVYSYATKARGRRPVAESEFGKRLSNLRYDPGSAHLVFNKRRARPTEVVSRPYLYTSIKLNGGGEQWLERYFAETKRPRADISFQFEPEPEAP